MQGGKKKKYTASGYRGSVADFFVSIFLCVFGLKKCVALPDGLFIFPCFVFFVCMICLFPSLLPPPIPGLLHITALKFLNSEEDDNDKADDDDDCCDDDYKTKTRKK